MQFFIHVQDNIVVDVFTESELSYRGSFYIDAYKAHIDGVQLNTWAYFTQPLYEDIFIVESDLEHSELRSKLYFKNLDDCKIKIKTFY